MTGGRVMKTLVENMERLVDAVKEDGELQERLRSGDEDSIMQTLASFEIYETDIENLNHALELMIVIKEYMGFWRFGHEAAE
jgi:hypothetical protein